MKFQDEIHSIPIDNFNDHYELVFDLISMQDATENCHYAERVGEPLRLELNFTFSLEHVTELIVLGERMSLAAVDKSGVVEKKSKIDNVSLQQIFNHITLLKYRYQGSFPSEYVPTLENHTFANIYTKPNNMQAKHWIIMPNSCQILYFAESLGCKKKFPQAPIRTDDARTTTVPSKRLRFLHNI